MTALAEEGGLLVPGDAAHRHAGEHAARHAGAHLPDPPGGRHDRAEGAAGYREESTQLLGPIEAPQIVQEGPGGIRGVGRVQPSPPFPGEVPEQPVVHRAEGEAGRVLDATVAQHPFPFRGGEVAVEHESCPLPDHREVAGLAQLVAAVGGAPVLPDDGPAERLTALGVPGDGRLALVGDAEGGDGLAPFGQAGRELGEGLLDEPPDLGGIVLDETGRGEVLGELPVGDAYHDGLLVDRESSHPGCPGIDRHHDAHRIAG